MAIALLGGTFDPVHKGHLAMAQAALEDPRFRLDRIIFIPADIPPHKQKTPVTPYADRFAMLEVALKGHPHFELSRVEDPAETKGEPNYSINTIRRMKRERDLSADDLYFIVGVDSFLQLDTWREPQAIISECRLIVANRPGFKQRELPYPPTIAFLETVSVDISSTMIREAVAHGEPLEKYVPPAVADYVLKHKLYR
jgi:nicotinate-nucleotide adenylyltransferase